MVDLELSDEETKHAGQTELKNRTFSKKPTKADEKADNGFIYFCYFY
jgi:hypothetical protein